MADDLEKLLAADETETHKPASETAPAESQAKKTEDEEIKKKAEQLENLNKAIQEAETTLRNKRKKPQVVEDEDLPKIDMNDPSSKAWNKHIDSKVAPALTELEQAKAERRMFALRQFLQNRPSIASNTEKIKKMMDTYEKIKSSSELTSEGILLDIERAYAADNYSEILATQDVEEFEKAKAESAASDIGVSRGASTTYASRQPKSKIQLSEDDKAVLAKWGMTPEEYVKLKEKTG